MGQTVPQPGSNTLSVGVARRNRRIAYEIPLELTDVELSIRYAFPNGPWEVLAITEKRIFLDVRREDWDSTFRKAGQVLLETTLSTTKRFTRYRCPNIPLGDVATEKSVGEP